MNTDTHIHAVQTRTSSDGSLAELFFFPLRAVFDLLLEFSSAKRFMRKDSELNNAGPWCMNVGEEFEILSVLVSLVALGKLQLMVCMPVQ